MGFQVQSYSLQELQRISTPGAVVPSLFWVLPVGQWRMGELDECWSMFTSPEARDCYDLGLLLVKEHSYRKRERKSAADLSLIAARLTDLIPEGARDAWASSAGRGEPRQLLFLSGAYPQPGWGVLVSPDGEDIARFVEQIVRRTVAALMENKNGATAIEAMRSSTRAFHDFRISDAASEEASTRSRSGDSRALQIRESLEALQELQVGLQKDILTGVQSAKQSSIDPRFARRLSFLDPVTLNEFKLAKGISELSDAGTRASVVALLQELLSAGVDGRAEIVRRSRAANVGPLIKLWLALKDRAPEPNAIVSWAGERVTSLAHQFRAELQKEVSSAEAELAALRAADSDLARKFEAGQKDRVAARRVAEERYRLALREAVDCQWEWGPRFLVALEALCRRDQVSCSSVPWDPARMVGWKLWSLGIPVTVEDLHAKARNLVGEAGIQTVADSPETANGSYFTDYVHFVVSHKIDREPREITSAFLRELVRPSERARIFAQLGEAPPSPEAAETEVVERLLQSLGWAANLAMTIRPLAGCIRKLESEWGVAPSLTGNDVRISAESFCKDMLDLMTSNMGGTGRELWDAVSSHKPNYRRSHQNWSAEIGSITLGPAGLIMEALGPRAFAGKLAEVGRLAKAVGRLSSILNAPSHHQEQASKAILDARAAGECIHEILDLAKILVAEMPWHFTTRQTIGLHPKILTGNAWSHSHPEERMVRILLWSGEPVGAAALVWNPTKTNPIMTDPKIIRRPS